MAALHVVFSHGQESGPWGTKITAMAEVARDEGCKVTSIDYQGIADPMKRVDKLMSETESVRARLLYVGSSLGGFVATTAALRRTPAGLFVLAPAFYVPGLERMTPLPPSCPMAIVHGWTDDVVPVDNAIRYGRDSGADLHILDSGHRLTDRIDQINDLLRLFIRRLRQAG